MPLEPTYHDDLLTLYHGHTPEVLASLETESVQCIVTSPPYWRKRKYTDDPREIGQEPAPAAYVAALAEVFHEARRVLRADGTLWLNLGDGYASSSTYNAPRSMHSENDWKQAGRTPNASAKAAGLPPKNLIGLPWRVAFALQDDGWILRNDIIWHKPNVMPESVTDRCCVDHEYIFLFSKSQRYVFDHRAIQEPAKGCHPSAASFRRRSNKRSAPVVPGNTATHRPDRPDVLYNGELRNARTVWSIPTEGLPDDHYAPMPRALAERCIRAGSRPDDVILDPFGGSGTTVRQAIALGRRGISIDLGYAELQERRTDGVQLVML